MGEYTTGSDESYTDVICESPPFVNETGLTVCGEPRGFKEIYMAAISCGTPEEIHQLLSYPGFMIDQHNAFCCTVLQSVARGHMADGVFILLKAGANVNITDDETGNSVLHDTISNMYSMSDSGENYALHGEAVVKLLVYYGADIHSVNKFGETALHIAAMIGEPRVVEFLLDQGAYMDLVSTSNDGHTPHGNVCYNIDQLRRHDNMPESAFATVIEKYEETKVILDNAMEYYTKCIDSIMDTCIMSDTMSLESKQVELENMMTPLRISETPRQIFQSLSDEGVITPFDDKWMYGDQIDVGGCMFMKELIEEERSRQSV